MHKEYKIIFFGQVLKYTLKKFPDKEPRVWNTQCVPIMPSMCSGPPGGTKGRNKPGTWNQGDPW